MAVSFALFFRQVEWANGVSITLNTGTLEMENWSMLGKPKEVIENKPEIFKEYVLPFGSLLIPAITYLVQESSATWASLAVAAYMVIVIVFLVVPATMRGIKKWKIHSAKKQMEANYFPQIAVLLRRFKPMMESSRSDTIWGVWSNGSRTSEMQTYIRPSNSHYYTLSAWLEHLSNTIDSTKPSDFDSIASEASAWVRQYVSFCQDGYYQFEHLLRSGEFDESKVREIKQSWNHARDEHNQTITNWKALCSEINSSFGQNICNPYCETLKTLE